MPSLHGSRRRHTKQTSSSKKSEPPPALSLSARSSTSSKSSDTQATPRSLFHSSLRPSRRPARDVRPIAREELMEPQGAVSPSEEKGSLDVFAFMERDDDPWHTPIAEQTPQEHEPSDDEVDEHPPRILTSKRVEASQISPRYSDLEVRAIQDGVQRAWGRASLHSDSGISVHSGSPDQDSPRMQYKYPMVQEAIPHPLEPSFENDDEPHMPELRDSPDFSARQGVVMHRHWPSLESRTSHDIPQACHVSPQAIPHDGTFVPSLDMPEMPSRSSRDLIHHPHHRRRRCSRPERPTHTHAPPPERKAGYDALASTISSHPHPHSHNNDNDNDNEAVLRPIYRKFETLNNRMLLYLQDEISEIEEQLSELDAAIAHEEAEMGRGPASRRAEAKLPSQLQWHRMELLGRSFCKIEQYNRALTSYTTLIRTVTPAPATDIAAYKAWIQAHTPIDGAETAFLDKGDDLLTITPQPPPPIASSSPSSLSSTSTSTPQQQTSPSALDSPVLVVLAFAFVATVLVFKVVPTMLARLVIGAVVGGAVGCFLGVDGTRLSGKGEWRRGVGMYAGVVGVLACVIC